MPRDQDGEHRVLSARTIVLWAIGLVLVAVVSIVLLWTMLGANDPRDSVRLDTIRTASSIVLGAGGAAALLLAARRQRSAELDLKQKDHDATERRVTELYGKAADQLGSDKAPIRLAGLYALERLAQDNPEHRQTIVNLICAYLRMPFDPSPIGRAAVKEARMQELEVRLAAQTLLTSHLRPLDEDGARLATYWPGIDLNLSNATLVKFSLTHAVVRSAVFLSARFIGPTTLRGATFRANADFRAARFIGLADFRRVVFEGSGAAFRAAAFEGNVNFGTHTEAALTGAVATVHGEGQRKWPDGWVEQHILDKPGWVALVRCG